MKFNFNWWRPRKADAPTTTNKDTENLDVGQEPVLASASNYSAFDYILANLPIVLFIGMGFMIYALFNTFTSFLNQNALFIQESERMWFSQTLMFSLMFVEVILALATSYFRVNGEWGRSFVVTAVAVAITYFNDLTIIEIFDLVEIPSKSVEHKIRLSNWLIFILGEICSYMMYSKGKKQQSKAPPEWFQAWEQGQELSYAPQSNGQKTRVTASANMGFQPKALHGKTQKARGNSIDYNRVWAMHQNGLKNVEIARALKCSEGHVSRVLSHLRKERS